MIVILKAENVDGEAGSENSSTADSEAPLALVSGIHEMKEKADGKGKTMAPAGGEKLSRALTKSFRYNLVN